MNALRRPAVFLALTLAPFCWGNFKLTVLHTNDMHAHVEPVKVKGKSVGGYARQATAIIQTRAESVNPILLNAGDTFQGTLFFNTYEGLADLAFMNLVGYQAMAVGNHEFDRGPQALADFTRLARFPVLSANVDVSNEPKLATLIKPTTILEVDGQKIGIVGATTPDLPNISSPGDLVKMKDYVKSVQAAVDSLQDQGVNKIILLSHTGYSEDLAFAKKLRGIDVVVGGHSHSLLGQVEIPDFTGSQGDYPTLTNDAAGKRVVVVQAWEWGKVLGKIEFEFDDKGEVLNFVGAPVLIDDSWPENPHVAAMMEAFNKPIQAAKTKPIGELTTDLTQRFSEKDGEGLMGNVIADAMFEATAKTGSQVAFWNAGGVRSPLTAGKITYGQLIEVCPFGNTLVVMDLTGAEIIGALEQGLESGGGMLLPSESFTYTFDPKAPNGSRVKEATLNRKPLEPATVYKVTVSNFTAGGGDSHFVLKAAKGKRIETGFVDIDALIEYFTKHVPVSASRGPRIKTAG